MLHLYPRAGLVALIISSVFTFILAAPVPIITGPGFSHSTTLSTHARHTSLNHQIRIAANIGTDKGAPPTDLDGVSVLEKRGRKAAKQKAAAKQRAPKQKTVPKKAAKQKASQKSTAPGAPKPHHKSIKEKLREFGHKVKKHFQNVGHKIKAGFQKFGQKVKVGFKKVGRWIKKNVAKVAKFALKVISTVGKFAAKVVRVIPGIGHVLSKGIEVASFATNKASDAIHANLGKLDKSMKRMDKAQKVLGYLPRELSMDELDERDDIFDWDLDTRDDFSEFEERDWLLDDDEGVYL